jgi:ATP-dependent DNA helicase PIF1
VKIAANQKIEHKPLASSTLNTFRNELAGLKLIFIDEISMVCFRMFNCIHQRLQEVNQSKEDFGGISIVVVGDLFQLKPVHDSYIFEQPSSSYMPLATNLWHEHFQMYELKQIMRQRECRDCRTPQQVA